MGKVGMHGAESIKENVKKIAERNSNTSKGFIRFWKMKKIIQSLKNVHFSIWKYRTSRNSELKI